MIWWFLSILCWLSAWCVVGTSRRSSGRRMRNGRCLMTDRLIGAPAVIAPYLVVHWRRRRQLGRLARRRLQYGRKAVPRQTPQHATFAKFRRKLSLRCFDLRRSRRCIIASTWGELRHQKVTVLHISCEFFSINIIIYIICSNCMYLCHIRNNYQNIMYITTVYSSLQLNVNAKQFAKRFYFIDRIKC